MSPQLRQFSLGLALVGCAASQYPDIDEPLPPGASSARVEPASALAADSAPSSVGSLARADVERVVDAGLGRFLSQVRVEPSLLGGKFQGWSIVGLSPPELWRGVDLRQGDVVTRVNGMPIEREVQAFDAFQAVRQAGALEVSYLRQGQPRSLRYAIVGKPSPSLPAQPAAPAASGSAAPAPAPATTSSVK